MSKRIFHGWYVVAACFLCMVVSGGIGWFTFPVFIKPFENEFGWTRTQIMGAVGLWGAMTGICSPIFGHFIDKWGARRMMLAGVVVTGLVTFALGETRSLVHLYTALLFEGVSMTACTYLPVASLISQWFVRRRGLAMSIAMVGMGVGGFVMPNVANILIESVGWRWTYRIFAVVTWVVLVPAVAMWVGSPEDFGLRADGDDGGTTVPPNPDAESKITGSSARQALTIPNFWTIGIADLTAATALVGVKAHMVAFSIDAGIESKVAAFVYSLIRGIMVLAMVIVGVAADRFNKRVMISLSYGLPALAIVFLIGLKSPGPLFLYAFILGVCSAAHVTLWALVVNDCFGARAYATVMGLLAVFWTIGTVIGPPLMGYIFDTTKSYYWAFIMAAALAAVSGLSMAFGAKKRVNHDSVE